TVQVPGEDVQRVHEPAVQRPVRLGAGADPPVDGGASGGRELAGRAADRLRGDAGDVRDPLGGEVDGEGAQVVQAVDASLQVLGGRGQLLGEQGVDERHEQERVRPRA